MSMSATNLINLNVDTFFEQHSVPEIDIVHKRIQTVVENKREELRTMVGERYRDLLKAADTIAAMQTSAGTLIEQVNCIHANCRSLNEQQLLGFKNAESGAETLLQKRSASKQLNNYYSTMVQIKLLTTLPELIWTHIDQEEFYAATQLFIYSRHISTGLQLDAQNALMQQLPVARKQWEILRTFHHTIKQSVLAVLERELLTADVAVDCMLSLLLLDKCSLTQVVQMFLQLRCVAFKHSLCGDAERGTGEVEHRRRVKERILASLRVLNGSVDLLDKCLLDNGLLFQRIAACEEPTTPPSIARMESSESQLAHLLPEIIANFRPKFETITLEHAELRATLDRWLADTAAIAATQLKQLFELVTNMQTIQEIKNEANNYKRQFSFGHIVERFGLSSQALEFYDLRYMPLINGRVHDIIRDSWMAARQATYVRLQELLTKQTAATLDIWQEQKSDLPLSLADALSEDLKRKKLLHRTKGYDVDIIELCSAFDAQLAAIVNELNVLLQEQTTRADDKLALIEFLRGTAQQQLSQYIGQMKALTLNADATTLLCVVRSCVALIELCPHLKICFCQQSSWRQWLGNVTATSVEHWQRICTLIEEETMQLWLRILDGILATQPQTQIMEQKATDVLTHEMVLEDFVNWQTITFEQKDEQDNAVQSNIRLPNQPRISLQMHLFALIRTLNTTVPQTLPSKVLQVFNQKLLAQLLAHYDALAQSERTRTCQNVALQLYFDLKFLQNVFAISRDERALHEQFAKLQNTLRDCIDPFDFELFAEHMTTNVKRAVARLSGEFGVLTAQQTTGSQASAQSIAAATLMAHEPDPNVLCLSSSGSTSLWFPLLPIVAPQAGGAGTIVARKAESEKSTPTRRGQIISTTTTAAAAASGGGGAAGAGATSSSSTARKNDTANKSKSSAASFFGMSQEWFR